MDTSVDRQQQVSFTNGEAPVAIQAGQYNVYGNNTVQYGQDPLKLLPHAAEAPFNSYTKQHEPTCLPNTRVDLLKLIYNWADGQDERCLFWLSGMAGTGKSTIARTVARNYFNKKHLGATFFFSRGGGDVSHAGKFVTSIAIQLAHNAPALRQLICDAITERSDIASQSLRDQWHQLVLRPLSKLDGNSCHSSYVLVVDALDECDDNHNIRIILHLLAEAQSLERVRLRIFLTSRSEIPIRFGFCQIPDAEHQDFVLHNISRSIVDDDISIFLKYNLRLIKQEYSLDAGWPGEVVIGYLIQIASGLFIWAATACRFIREGKRFAAKRLNTILQGSNSAPTAPAKHLDEIYITVLKQSIALEYTDKEKEESYFMLRQILGCIVILLSPLSISSLSRLLCATKEDTNRTLDDLHSVIDVPKDQTQPLRLHHPSFRNFLLNNDRCKDQNFWIDEKKAHRKLADMCIRLMSTSLKQDICGLDAPGVLVTEVDSNRVERSLPFEIQYACLYWIQHLQKSCAQLHENDQVHQFLQEHFLCWLEALGWMKKLSEGIHAIVVLESIAAEYECPRLSEYVYDMKRFALYFRQAIEHAPLQIYCSALIFAPEMSLVKKQFKDRIPQWVGILPKMEQTWNELLQTLEGHTNPINAVTFSPNGAQLASASDDQTVRLWDFDTGAIQQILEGHTGAVQALVYSPNGKQLASASSDCTVRIWDTETGCLQRILQGHTKSVRAIIYLPNGQQLASGSVDYTVRLWDTETGRLQQTLQGHSGSVNTLVFSLSPHGCCLASTSDDHTVRLWDTETVTLRQTLDGHSDSVLAVTFSPDGKRIASASIDHTVRIWETEKGAHQWTLEGHSDCVNVVVYSPNGKQLASASYDGTIRLWEAETGALQQVLVGHSDLVCALLYSPNGRRLFSASWDNTIRLYDADTGTLQQILVGHHDSIDTMAFSANGKRLASGSQDNTVRLWDTGIESPQQASQGHTDCVKAVTFSPDGRSLASASWDHTVKLWNSNNGTLLRTLRGHTDRVTAVIFSPDGHQIASASEDRTANIWNAETGALLQKLGVYSEEVSAIVFSPDGRRLASAGYKDTIRIWDSEKGALQNTLKGHFGYVSAIAFSPDNCWLASASVDTKVRICNVKTEIIEQVLEGHTKWIDAVAFSPDGRRLASASRDDTVMVWHTDTGALEQTFRTGVSEDPWLSHYGSVKAMTFSPNGQRLITNLGSMDLVTSNPGFHTAHWSSYSLPNYDRHWIMWNGCRVLWLPVDYRPVCQNFHGNCLAMGYKSGRVIIIGFKTDVSPIQGLSQNTSEAVS